MPTAEVKRFLTLTAGLVLVLVSTFVAVADEGGEPGIDGLAFMAGCWQGDLGGGTTIRERRDLWDMPIVFLLLVGIVGSEWGYRKLRGLA